MATSKSDMWEAGPDVREIMLRLVSKHHPNLALVDKEIAIVFKAKASKRGGQVVLGGSKKAPGILNVLGKGDYKFILEVAADEWSGLSDDQRVALIDHLLCGCQVKENEDDGTIKCSIIPPDVQFYYAELERHGDWRPRPQEQNAVSLSVEEMLGGGTSSPQTPTQ